MSPPSQNKIIIIGSDLSAWMACAFFASQRLSPSPSIQICTGVDAVSDCHIQSTLPQFKDFLRLLGIVSSSFVKEASVQAKLGSVYQHSSQDFYHIWGEYGAHRGAIEFHQIYIRAIKEGLSLSLNDLSVAAKAAELNRFAYPIKNRQSIRSTYDFSLAFDTDVFISLLKNYCFEAQALIDDRKVVALNKNDLGAIIKFSDGAEQNANFVINTSPTFNGGIEFKSWDKNIPFRVRSKTAHRESNMELVDKININQDVVSINRYSRSTREEIIYGPHEGARDGQLALKRYGCVNEPHQIAIVHLGRAAICLESPWISMADLTWLALKPFLKMFPDVDNPKCVADEYNRSLIEEYESLRDLVQLFWNSIATKMGRVELCSMQKSAQLEHKESLYNHRGKLPFYENETYQIQWQLWLLLGLGIMPRHVEPITEHMDSSTMLTVINAVKTAVAREANAMQIY
jgi:tryptophan halogenase